jgi:hypothetical protein
MKRLSLLLLLAGSVALAGCHMEAPTETRSDTKEFPVTAKWSATAAPVAPSTVAGTLSIQQRLGYRMNASFSMTGTPGTTYQWRIFRGDCTVNVAALNNTSATGLVLFATAQSYPEIKLDAAGNGSTAPVIAGELDSLTTYSVRIRVSQTSTSWNGTNPIACGNLQRGAAG